MWFATQVLTEYRWYRKQYEWTSTLEALEMRDIDFFRDHVTLVKVLFLLELQFCLRLNEIVGFRICAVV